MWQQFTEHARSSILSAQQEAVARGNSSVGPEHLLLGLLNPDYLSHEALEAMNIPPEVLRAAVESRLPGAASPREGEPKLTVEAKLVLELAADEARRMQNNHIGPEHLLLALLRRKHNPDQELDFLFWNALHRFKLISDATLHAHFNRWRANDHIARQVLREHGVELETTRLVIAQLLGAPMSVDPFSEPVQRAIVRAQREAEKTGAARIGTAHILLGLLGEDPHDAQPGSGTLRDLLRQVDKASPDDTSSDDTSPDDVWDDLRASLRTRLVADGELRSNKTKFTLGAQRAFKMSMPEAIAGGASQITVKSLLSGLERATHPPRRVRLARKLGLPSWKTAANDAPPAVLEVFGLDGKGIKATKSSLPQGFYRFVLIMCLLTFGAAFVIQMLGHS